MTDESVPPEQDGGSSPTPRRKLDKATRNRAEAARLIAAAEKFEADKARSAREGLLRDHRILGGLAMELAEKAPDLARVLIEGIGSCSVSKFDRKHLERDGSALAQLRAIMEAQSCGAPAAPEKPVSVPTVAWFDVPFSERERVPPGVLYDPEVKARCALSREVVQQMRDLGFVERQDLADRPPPVRKPPASPT